MELETSMLWGYEPPSIPRWKQKEHTRLNISDASNGVKPNQHFLKSTTNEKKKKKKNTVQVQINEHLRINPQ